MELVGGGLVVEGWRSGGKAIRLWMFSGGKQSLERSEEEMKRLWMLSGGKVRRWRSLSETVRGWRDGQERERCPTRWQ